MIRIQAKGLDRTILAEVRERMQAPGPALKPIGEQLRGHIIRDSFGLQIDPQGKPWPAFSPNSRRKRGRMSRAKLLVDTGQLRGAITVRAVAQSILVGISGNAARYGLFHQFGTRHIPRRAFLPLDEAGRPLFAGGWARPWADRSVKRLERWIAKGARG